MDWWFLLKTEEAKRLIPDDDDDDDMYFESILEHNISDHNRTTDLSVQC
jgi:hypothetical protein